MAPHKVIVFGPTGAVGSSAARTAHALGAHVVLAMRDTSKSIPGLSSSEESSGNYSRYTADLTDAASVSAVVQKTDSKHAFIYHTEPDSDGMLSTITALQKGGIELVVFLSSFSIQGPIREVPEKNAIPWVHARVEVNLENVFGQGNYVAVRPGSFASNNLQYLEGIKKGEVDVWMPDATVDCITPEDIGRVAGTALVKGVPEDGNTTPYLVGPRLYKQSDAIEMMAEQLGRSVKIRSATRVETRSAILAMGFPEHMVDYMLDQVAKTTTCDAEAVLGIPVDKDWAANVEKYSGFKSTSFEDWVSANLKST